MPLIPTENPGSSRQFRTKSIGLHRISARCRSDARTPWYTQANRLASGCLDSPRVPEAGNAVDEVLGKSRGVAAGAEADHVVRQVVLEAADGGARVGDEDAVVRQFLAGKQADVRPEKRPIAKAGAQKA